MKKTLLGLSVLALFAGSTAMALPAVQPEAAVASSSAASPEAKINSMLFTQLASSATITPAPGANNYTLTLNDVSSSTTWFTDRPERHSGVVTTEDFVQHWKKGGTQSFAKDAPNANLVIFRTGIDGIKQSSEHIVELRDPVYSSRAHTLSYQITLVPSRKMSTSKFPVAQQTEEVALFIDTFDPITWGWNNMNGWL